MRSTQAHTSLFIISPEWIFYFVNGVSVIMIMVKPIHCINFLKTFRHERRSILVCHTYTRPTNKSNFLIAIKLHYKKLNDLKAPPNNLLF